MEGRDRYREVGQIPMRVKRKLVNQSDPSLKFFFFLTSKLDEFVRRFVSIRMKYFILFFFYFITSSRRFFFFVTMVSFHQPQNNITIYWNHNMFILSENRLATIIIIMINLVTKDQLRFIRKIENRLKIDSYNSSNFIIDRSNIVYFLYQSNYTENPPSLSCDRSTRSLFMVKTYSIRSKMVYLLYQITSKITRKRRFVLLLWIGGIWKDIYIDTSQSKSDFSKSDLYGIYNI